MDLIDDSLTQNEIYEIVTDTSASKCLKSKEVQFKVSVASSDEKNDGKIQVDKELEVNDQASENELRNSEVELEHGNLPQNSSHCQFSSPPSSSFKSASISSSEFKTEINVTNNKETIPNQSAPTISSDSSELSYCNKETNLKNISNKLSDPCDTSDIKGSILPHRFDHSDRDMLSNLEIASENTDTVKDESPNSQSGLSVSLPQSGLICSTESSSDSEDFIEVSEDPNLSTNDNSNETNTIDFHGPSIPTQIIIDSTGELKDDMFSDIFTNPNNEELKDSNKVSVKDNTVRSDEINTNNIEKSSCEEVTLSNLSDKKLNQNDSTYSKCESVHDGISDTNFMGSSNEGNVNSIIPQLSVDEIVVMKKDLEQESNLLRNEALKEDRIASTITEQIIHDAQQLLQLFGIPFIIAPLEAEAQCAYLDLTHQTQGTITDDSDIWLFGGRTVYKNFFDQKKYVQQFKSSDITRCLHMGRDDMIMLALLSGSDYTPGLTGVGAVTALEIIAHFPQNEKESTIVQRLAHFADDFKKSKLKPNISSKLKKISISQGFPSSEVVKAYLEPLVDQSTEPFSWQKPKLAELRNYAKEKFGWNETRIDKLLQPVFENLNRTEGQGTLHRYFEWNFEGIENQMSKRVERAVTLLKKPCLLDVPFTHGKSKKEIIGNSSKSTDSFHTDSSLTIKSKTPAQIAREKAAKKIKELKKQGKFKPKSKK